MLIKHRRIQDNFNTSRGWALGMSSEGKANKGISIIRTSQGIVVAVSCSIRLRVNSYDSKAK
jgi:hypothetical protein